MRAKETVSASASSVQEVRRGESLTARKTRKSTPVFLIDRLNRRPDGQGLVRRAASCTSVGEDPRGEAEGEKGKIVLAVGKERKNDGEERKVLRGVRCLLFREREQALLSKLKGASAGLSATQTIMRGTSH